jgi:hypothetical protein
MEAFLREWFWDRAAFTLAIFVLGGQVLDLVTANYNLALLFAFGQTVMAIVILVKEGVRLADEKALRRSR